MHVFFESVWRLHIGEIPEKPKSKEYLKNMSEAIEKTNEWMVYVEAIAAIKQNALTVGNPDVFIVDEPGYGKFININGQNHIIEPGKFYPWTGGYKKKCEHPCMCTIRMQDGLDYNYNCKEVAILTLPEEKKNTMENMAIEEKADEYIKQYLPHVNTTGHWLGFQDGYKQALSEISGSVAAPKEEKSEDFGKLKWKVGQILAEQFLKYNDGKFIAAIELNPATHALTEFIESELASLRQQLEQKTIALDSYYKLAAEVAPLKEALKELLSIVDKSHELFLNDKDWAIIERARKTLNK